jgi:altronate hydrolase
MHISLQETATIHLHSTDNIVIAMVPLNAQRTIDAARRRITLNQLVGAGHKIAIEAIAVGEPVRRYGQIIGFATMSIAAGDHVHTHNLHVGSMQLDYAVGSAVGTVEPIPTSETRTFMGYHRPDGSVGTRNTVAVIGTVNCSSHTLKKIVDRAKRELGYTPSAQFAEALELTIRWCVDRANRTSSVEGRA